MNQIVPYIDWKPFFDVWQLKGKYPNRGYPKIFNDETVGSEAKSLFKNAEDLLEKIIKEKSLKANGVFGIFKCNSNDQDDILVYDESGAHIHTLHGLRQQVNKLLYNIKLLFIKIFNRQQKTLLKIMATLVCLIL